MLEAVFDAVLFFSKWGVNILSHVEELLKRARQGVPAAVDDLLDEYRDRLKTMVSLRLDPRVNARIDPSDVVQESMAEAASRLDQYLIDEPIPFYPWLRQIAWEKLIQLHRRHIGSQKRSAAREVSLPVRITDESVASLSRIAIAQQDSPSEQVVRSELNRRVLEAVERLQPSWKELLVMRYLEQMSVADIAATLKVSAAAVSMRHLRAVEALRSELSESD